MHSEKYFDEINIIIFLLPQHYNPTAIMPHICEMGATLFLEECGERFSRFVIWQQCLYSTSNFPIIHTADDRLRLELNNPDYLMFDYVKR